MADGCNYNNMRLQIKLSGKDYDHLVKFERDLGRYKHPRVNVDKNGFTSAVSSIDRKEVSNWCARFNIIPRKSLVAKPPETLSTDQIRHFIRGYFDGDGSVILGNGSRNKYITISFCGSKDMMEYVAKFVPFEHKCSATTT